MRPAAQGGFSLVEALLAAGAFSLVVTVLAGALVLGQQSSVGSGKRSRAVELAEEGVEAVRSIRDQALNELQYSQSGVGISSNTWAFLGEGTTETIDEFTRTTTFADVCRNGSKAIVACPGSYTDPRTKQVTVTVTWSGGPAATGSVSRTTYLTDWEASTWTQTDWSGGSGQATWSDITRFDSSDGNVNTSVAGEVTLAASGSGSPIPWWDTSYGFRKPITFGTSHSALSTGYTVALVMDTRPSTTNVELTSGNDVRIVWQPTSGSAVELDRIGSTWDSATSSIEFRLQSDLGANANLDSDGYYYVYYGNAAAGTPPTNEMNVYYFADFFNRTNSSTIGNGWTEWNTGGGNVSIASNTVNVVGNNVAPADAGIKQTFPLGAITGDFTVAFDWTMPSNTDGTWGHYLNVGSAMGNGSRTSGVGPGIYNGEGSQFVPNGVENISNDLSGNMENGIHGGPQAIRLVVDATNKDYDYYRGGVLRASNQNWVNAGATINQIRIATDRYAVGQPAFVYDNLKVTLDVATGPTMTGGTEEALASTAITDDTQAEFNAGTYTATQYDTGNSWVELTGAGQTAGTGTYSSKIFDAVTAATWNNSFAWTSERPTNKELPNNASVADWWDASYGYRKKITFGTSHSALSAGYTTTLTMDTRPSTTNVELTSGNDVRIVWQPTSGAAVELDRIGSTWDSATSSIEFRLQSAIAANLDEDTDGSYYVYYGNAAAGTPPTNEMNVYYFADFFNRSNSSTIGNGWTEWTTGGGNVSIASNAINVVGNNTGPADAGIKQTFPLGALPGNFTLAFDWTMPSNSEGTWTHYLNVGNSATMTDSSRTTGVGPGIYNGEGSHFSPNGTTNISNDLTGNMENNVTGGPYAVRLVVNTSAQTYDYYRGGILRASGQTYATAQGTLDQLRIATDQYVAGQPAFVYDNLKLTLDVASAPTISIGAEGSSTSGESGYPTGNVSMSGNVLLHHLNETAGATSFADSSGYGRNASCTGVACPTSGGTGKLSAAPTFDGVDDMLTSSVDLTQWLGGTASLSVWIKTTQTGNATFWQAPGITGVEQSGAGNDIFWGWLDNTGRIGFKVGDGAGVQSTGAVNDGQWHHIAMTRNATSGQITLYVDGAQHGQTTSDTGLKTTTFDDFGVIGDTGGSPVYFAGQLDELSVWNAVLSSTQVTDLYRRAALRLKFQVRSCNDSACSGETFIGPDGTGSSYYSELQNVTLTPSAVTLANVPSNRYFQYQATFETDNASLSPELLSVTTSYPTGGSGVGSGYQTAGSLVSSAFNLTDASPVEVLEWDEVVPSCSPACTVKLQVRTAPDASGSPGTWTAWYGATGIGTYFTAASGTRLPVALNGNRWVQYRVELAGDGASTPTLQATRLYYR